MDDSPLTNDSFVDIGQMTRREWSLLMKAYSQIICSWMLGQMTFSVLLSAILCVCVCVV